MQQVSFIYDTLSEVSVKERYNNAVHACIACHQTTCLGPIPKIKNYSSTKVKREIIITADGSNSLLIPQWQETFPQTRCYYRSSSCFYSRRSAVLASTKYSATASLIRNWIWYWIKRLLTLLQAQENLSITYETLEAYPLSFEEINALNYSEVLQIDKQLFERLHRSPWEEPVEIIPQFRIKKERRV